VVSSFPLGVTFLFPGLLCSVTSSVSSLISIYLLCLYGLSSAVAMWEGVTGMSSVQSEETLHV
jgi:hypothetical protein